MTQPVAVELAVDCSVALEEMLDLFVECSENPKVKNCHTVALMMIVDPVLDCCQMELGFLSVQEVYFSGINKKNMNSHSHLKQIYSTHLSFF